MIPWRYRSEGYTPTERCRVNHAARFASTTIHKRIGPVTLPLADAGTAQNAFTNEAEFAQPRNSCNRRSNRSRMGSV